MNADNQISLIDFESPEQKEHDFLESILPTLKTAIASYSGDGKLLTYKSTKLLYSSGISQFFDLECEKANTIFLFRLYLVI